MQRRLVHLITRKTIDVLCLALVLTAYMALRAFISPEPLMSLINVVGGVLLAVGVLLAGLLVDLKEEYGSVRKAVATHYSWRRAGVVVLAGVVLVELVARVG